MNMIIGFSFALHTLLTYADPLFIMMVIPDQVSIQNT